MLVSVTVYSNSIQYTVTVYCICLRPAQSLRKCEQQGLYKVLYKYNTLYGCASVLPCTKEPFPRCAFSNKTSGGFERGRPGRRRGGSGAGGGAGGVWGRLRGWGPGGGARPPGGCGNRNPNGLQQIPRGDRFRDSVDHIPKELAKNFLGSILTPQ